MRDAPRVRSASSLQVAAVAGAVVVAALAIVTALQRDAGGDETALDALWDGSEAVFEPGTYTFAKQERFGDVTQETVLVVHWTDPSDWVKVVEHRDSGQPDQWVVRDGDAVHTANPGFARHASSWRSDPQHPELPEQFLFDPRFLIQAVAADRPDHGVTVADVEWEAPASAPTPDDHLPLPERLVVADADGHEIAFELQERREPVALGAADAVEQLRAEGVRFDQDP